MKTAEFGSISHGTMRPVDLIDTFASELASLVEGDEHKALLAECEAWEKQDDENNEKRDGELLEQLFDALDEASPAYGYFGGHPGNSSDYGFWLPESWQQNAKDDGVVFVNDLSEVESSLHTVCEVNDHGNATLYSVADAGTDGDGNTKFEFTEIWSLV